MRLGAVVILVLLQARVEEIALGVLEAGMC
jgi:hypothetical protein